MLSWARIPWRDRRWPVDDSNRQWVRLKFDGRSRFGSRQHYFHFTWGYLLPALDRMLPVAPDPPGVGFELESCGPSMDPRMREVAEWIAAPVRIVPPETGGKPADLEERLARWDVWLRGRTSLPIRLASGLHRHGLRHPVLAGIERVRDFVLMRALAEGGPRTETPTSLAPSNESSAPTAPERREWLLLKRSEEPSFYRVGGPAEKPTYGVTRRSIANLDALAGELARRGLPIRIYEPGLDALAQQARTYHAAAGVIGVRGAELANIVWMRPRSGVVMLVTPVERENNVARHIALVCGLRARPIRVASDHPVVSPDDVMREIERAGS